MAKSKPTPPPPPPASVGTDGPADVASPELPPADDDTAEIVVTPPAEPAPPPPAEKPVARDHGFGKWLVHVPAHCAPREVEAGSAAEAVEKYKQQMGIVSLPAAPVAEAVSHPHLPAPSLAVLTPAE